MFWQGGGKKRLKKELQSKMEIPKMDVPFNHIGKTDDELLHIYYHRHEDYPIQQQPLSISNVKEVSPIEVSKEARDMFVFQSSSEKKLLSDRREIKDRSGMETSYLRSVRFMDSSCSDS